MTPTSAASLREQVRQAVEAAWQAARGRAAPTRRAARNAGHHRAPGRRRAGDFATTIALRLAKPYRRPPLEIAKAIAAHVTTTATDPGSPIAAVEVAPPGF